ncbi:response regulator [Daejeonella oryzae]|uniref:response regulator n=1 Tax=Daejeonella oryzae TaxID=1122943 RepID=UPI00047C1E13|nr:response regulator transcription factor [Daejeonella oryzae]
MIKVLLAEDHNIVRHGIKSLLDNESDMEVIADVRNGKEAMHALGNGVLPNIILVDLNMPEMGGMELVKEVSRQYSEVFSVVLSMTDHDHYVNEALIAGAKGYLLKNVQQEELIFAIRHIADGGKYVCSELAMRIISRASHSSDQHNGEGTGNFVFTKREMEVLKLISEGFTNNEIADKLFTSRRTVEGHRQSLIEKTGVPNSAALIMHAFRGGILK